MILYKKDTKGNIRYLNIWTISDTLYQESGILDTDKPIIHSKACKPKNVGKSNETTGEQQALSEAKSLEKSKLDEGYFYTKEEAENELVILPMLAKSYDDEKHKIDWSGPVYIQPKLDGMRCLAIIKNGQVTLKSRDGKTIENMDHIIKELSSIKEDVILDGELYAHGLSFQENMKLIKKYREGETEQIKYHIYDLISDEPYDSRRDLLFQPIHDCDDGNLWEVDTFLIESTEELKKYHQQNIQEGYEGSIIRHGNKSYGVNKRCDSLLKYKDFQDIAATIIDIVPAEQRSTWGVPILEFNGKTFRAGTKMSFEDKEDLLTNKNNYINKTAEIRFFEYTDDGIPRFPIMVGIRLDK